MDYEIAYLIAALVVLVIHIILAYQAGKIAEAKGHDSSTWGFLCFLTGFCGCILVAALPDNVQSAREQLLVNTEQQIAHTLNALLTTKKNQPKTASSNSSTAANKPNCDSNTTPVKAETSAPIKPSPRPFIPVKENSTWVCPNCKTTNPENAMFCVNCGEIDSRIETWTCRRCGEMNPWTFTSCANCDAAKE